MFFKSATIAFFAGLAAAYHAPVGDPTGNPIATPGLNQVCFDSLSSLGCKQADAKRLHPPALNALIALTRPFAKLSEACWRLFSACECIVLRSVKDDILIFLPQIVPAGTPFEITWDPTTTNTVSLVLLRGPSTNVVPLYAIVEGIANTGSYSWTPSTDLEADVTHYGLEIIDDVNGQYQYSTQFGISNDYVSSSSSSSAAGYSTAVSSASADSYSTAAPYSTYAPASSTAASTSCLNSTTTVYVPPTGTGYATATGGANSTIILPSKSLTVPSSLLTSATGSATTTAPLQATGAAGHVKAGVGAVFGAAALAFVL